ncbi:MAG: glycosyltransferase family 4 protein [Proteobacteria bacterium]|nr:glycosyltransferase family 4 protein [Pseudomonadota bacterium]
MPETSQAKRSILVIAPQPFFQNRGTPIAVRLLVEELARLGHDVHLLVFNEGEDVTLPGVSLHRIPAIWGIKNIPPSLSFKKIICDVFMFFKAISLLRRHNFTVIHAVEEAAFIAMVLKMLFGTPYIYDMDSSLARQIVEKFSFLQSLGPALRFCERFAVKESCGVVAVCRALEDIAQAYAPEKLIVRLEDISLLEDSVSSDEILRHSLQISGPIMLYVGNLEKYQGIDLLLQSFQLALAQGCLGNLVIIGGTPETLAAYKKYAEELQVANHTFFCGPRPVELLGHYLAQADILLSPRIQGNNTPMKLYSYLDSGKAVLATDLPTHTQVLTNDFACLVEPEKQSMAAGMAKLLDNPELCLRLGAEGQRVARENYSLAAFRAKLSDFYSRIFSALLQPPVH